MKTLTVIILVFLVTPLISQTYEVVAYKIETIGKTIEESEFKAKFHFSCREIVVATKDTIEKYYPVLCEVRGQASVYTLEDKHYFIVLCNLGTIIFSAENTTTRTIYSMSKNYIDVKDEKE